LGASVLALSNWLAGKASAPGLNWGEAAASSQHTHHNNLAHLEQQQPLTALSCILYLLDTSLSFVSGPPRHNSPYATLLLMHCIAALFGEGDAQQMRPREGE
jgi:hypothetical protein